MEFPILVVDMICIVELGPKEEDEESGVGIIDDCMTGMMVGHHNNFHSWYWNWLGTAIGWVCEHLLE